MADITVVYWRDIPAQIIVKAGRAKAARKLDERFEQAIDRAAMKSGAAETDAYLAEWRKVVEATEEGDLDAIADAWAAKIDAEWDRPRLVALANAGGRQADL